MQNINATATDPTRMAEEQPGVPWRPSGPEHCAGFLDAWEGMVADPLPQEQFDTESFGLHDYDMDELYRLADTTLTLMKARGHLKSTLAEALLQDKVLGRQIVALCDTPVLRWKD